MYEQDDEQKSLQTQIDDLGEYVGALYVQTTRVYDVLLTLLKHFDPEDARKLAELHESGGVLSPIPVINGE